MSLDTYLRRLDRIILQKCFRFDKWHIAKLQEHPYAVDIVMQVNKHNSSKSFGVELGCGLGDIISHIVCDRKIGYDIDLRVLRAARFLNFFRFNRNGRLTFEKLDFIIEELEGICDFVVAVNFLHHYNPVELKKALDKIYEYHLSKNGLLVVDTVQNTGYEYNHKIDQLTAGWTCDVLTKDGYEYSRSVHFILKKMN